MQLLHENLNSKVLNNTNLNTTLKETITKFVQTVYYNQPHKDSQGDKPKSGSQASSRTPRNIPWSELRLVITLPFLFYPVVIGLDVFL